MECELEDCIFGSAVNIFASTFCSVISISPEIIEKRFGWVKSNLIMLRGEKSLLKWGFASPRLAFVGSNPAERKIIFGARLLILQHYKNYVNKIKSIVSEGKISNFSFAQKTSVIHQSIVFILVSYWNLVITLIS